MKKGTYVLRSTYQKLAEENKRLLNDIRILTEDIVPPTFEKITITRKWRKKITEDKVLAKALQGYAEEYFKMNPIVK